MQLHSSYVVTDPKGSIVVECGKLLQRNQYKIKILNTINFKKSHHYNPFAYLHSEKDILKLVTTLIANTQGDGKSGDDFWRKAETLLYTALIGYIYYEAPVEEQNFATLIEMINTMEEELGYKVTKRQQGGRNGGSACLTPEGEALLAKYQELERRSREAVDSIFEELFGPLD